VLMFTSDPMVVPKALELLPSNLLTMLVMPSSNSMATTGKAALSRYVKIASLALDPDSVEVVSALVEDLAEVSVLEAVDSAVVGSVVVLEVVVDSEAAMVVRVVTMVELALSLLLPTPLPTMPLLVLREARPSTSATFLGPQATRISSSSSPPSERSSKPKFSTSQMADLEALALFASTLLRMRRLLSRNSLVTSMEVAHSV